MIVYIYFGKFFIVQPSNFQIFVISVFQLKGVFFVNFSIKIYFAFSLLNIGFNLKEILNDN